MGEERDSEEKSKLDDIRGSPMDVGSLEEFIDENHCIVSTAMGPEYYVNILSFVDKDQLEPGSSVLMHHKALSVIGILADEVDPLVSVMKTVVPSSRCRLRMLKHERVKDYLMMEEEKGGAGAAVMRMAEGLRST